MENHKPHPEMIDKAMEMLNANRKETLIIGDSKSDLGAGINSGVDTALFHTPAHQDFYDQEKLMEYKPVFVFDDFVKLQEFIILE